MAARRTPKASQGPASPRLALSEHAPSHLKVLADRLARTAPGTDDATDALRACLDCVAGHFGGIALALAQKNNALSTNDAWSLRAPLTATAWRLLLADACHALEGTSGRLPRELVRACADTGWRDVRVDSWPAEPIESALTAWVTAAAPFFARWSIVRGGDATVLRGQGADLDLSPFIRIEDCPDCDGVANTFLYDGPASPGRLRYRNLHNGHATSLPLPSDAPSWMHLDAPLVESQRPVRSPAGSDPRHLRLQRALLDLRGGYIVVRGNDRAGKSGLARRLQHDAALAQQGFRVLRVTACEGDAVPASLWLQTLDEQLRGTPAALPPRELVRELQRLDSAEHRTRAWLSAIAGLDEGPLALVVDDLHAWPQSAEFWPTTLPAGTFVVLMAAPDRLTARLRTRLEQLVEAGAMAMTLPDSATPPPAPTAVLPVLTRLAAAARPLPTGVLIDQVGRDACLRAAKWVRPADEGMEPLHPVSTHPEWKGRYAETCAQMAWWARDVILDATAPAEVRAIARDGLWRWAREGGAAVRLARSPGLAACLDEALSEIEEEAPLQVVTILTDWLEALRPLFTHEPPVVEIERLLDLGLRRAELLLRLGSHADGAQAAATDIARVSELVRTGRADLGIRLAQALVIRAGTALHRNMPTTAVEDCSRALELCALHEVRDDEPAPSRLVARAHWTLGLAFAATGNLEAGTLSVERAAALHADEHDANAIASAHGCAILSDLASLLLQGRRLVEAESACNRALDATPPDDLARRAQGLHRRAVVRTQRQHLEEADADLRAAVDLYATTIMGGRTDLCAAGAQARFELGSRLASCERLAEAREQVDESARLYRIAIDQQGRRGCRPALAQVLNEHGLVCARLDLLDEAIHLCTQAVDLGTLLLEREKRSSIRSELARALNNRARAFASSSRSGSVPAALRDYKQAVAHYEALIHRQHRYEFRHHLALVHYNRGGLHRGQNEMATAAREYRRAVELLSEVRAEHATREVTLDLAAALTNEALVLEAADGLAAYRQAVELLVGIYDSDDTRTALALAAALHGEGRARATLARWEQASGDFTAALGLYRKLRRVSEIAAALLDRGRSSMALRRFDQAAADFDEASRTSHGTVRAAALCGLGGALRACAAHADARVAYDSALQMYADMKAAGDRPLVDLAETFMARALLRLDRDDADGALGDVDSAARTLQALDAGLPPARARLPLAVGNLRARALVKCGRWEEAMRTCQDVHHELSRLPTEDAESARLLAEASAIRGRAEQGRHHLREAVDAFTRAIAAWSRQADEAREVGMCLELARVYRDRADAQRALGQTASAVCDYGWTIDLLHELSSEHDVRGLAPELATARAARGLLLLRDARLREAVVDLQGALDGGVSREPLSGLDVEAALQRATALLEARKPC